MIKNRTLFVFIFLIFALGISAQDNNLPIVVPEKKNEDLTAEQIIEQNKPALVSIWFQTNDYFTSGGSYAQKDTTLLSGSGFIFDERGFVGTNYHVIQGFDSLLIKTSDGTFFNASLVYVEEKNDLAILKIIDSTERKFPFIKFGNSDKVKVGNSIYAIGSPLGFEYTISEGIVAAIREKEKVSFNDPDTYAVIEKIFDKVIQITAAISPGNSGGALFNSQGEVIGITTYSYGFYGNLNFAIAINSLSNLIKSINIAKIDENEEFLKKRQENLFNTNFRLAGSFKSKVISNWYYTKQLDTMKKVDTIVLKQDSLNKINLKKAEYYYNICLEQKPDTFYIYRDLLDMYVFVENYTKAEQLYTALREKFTSDSLQNILSSSFAEGYSVSKDYRKALMFYEKLSRKDTSDQLIPYQLAYLNEMLKNYDKAIKGYNTIIRRDSSHLKAFIQLGGIYYNVYSDYKKAKKYLNIAMEKNEAAPDYSFSYPELYYYMGMIAAKEGRKTEALLNYIELKKMYLTTKEEKNRKQELYKQIIKMDE